MKYFIILVIAVFISLPSFAANSARKKNTVSGKLWAEINGQCKYQGFHFNTTSNIFKFNFVPLGLRYANKIIFKRNQIVDFWLKESNCPHLSPQQRLQSATNDTGASESESIDLYSLCFGFKTGRQKHIFCPFS